MTKQLDSTQKLMKVIPKQLHPYIETLANLAITTLETEAPYHTFRITPEHFELAGEDHVGRLVGWMISATTQQGWEYENASFDGRTGTMWLMFKNPYVFS